ncbi:S1 RNA-binding domain-containing protein [Candidatus Woesearchaeota archaeon]|nr:MAG: S1 RNA-binding domain-containing protein [Candidatus Woesearchaeota archaeon]
MFFKREGFPEEDELVLCTVIKVQYHSVTCRLDEYGKNGMIHISEVSPGRIRNIRDYVVEGKRIVCKVLRINKEKGYIDLSLRRVNEAQRRLKMEEIKQEQKAEKIIEQLATDEGVTPKELYDKIAPSILSEYGHLHKAFIDVVENGATLTKLVGKELGEKLEHIVKEKIKPKSVVIEADAKLSTPAEGGADLIIDVLTQSEKAVPGLEIKYRGAGTWHYRIEAKDFKTAEKLLKDATAPLSQLEKQEGTVTITRSK